MKRLITLLTLLLAAPSLASAQDPFIATSGSMVVQFGDQEAPFTASGFDFSYSAVIQAWALEPLLNYPVSPGSNGLLIQGDTGNPNLGGVSLSVQGAPWVLPNEPGPGFASARFITNKNFIFTGPGTYFSTFSFNGGFFGVPLSVQLANPGEDCIQLMCTQLFFYGAGSVAVDVVPYPNIPGALEIEQATFIFKRVPEPSTIALLLLGFAALVLLPCGIRSRYRSIAVLACSIPFRTYPPRYAT